MRHFFFFFFFFAVSRCWVLDVAKVLLQLLEEDEGDDSVRAQPHKGRNVALVKGEGTSLTSREAHQIQGTCFCVGTKLN
jgi:hypothetical protein